MAAYLDRMPAGVPGDPIGDLNIVEGGFLDPATGKTPTAFGGPMKISAGKFQKIEASDNAKSVYGFLLRTAPQIGVSPDENGNATGPSAKFEQGVLKAGYENAVCAVGTPVRGKTVFMRVVAATGKAVGDLEADADGANSVELTNVEWSVDGKDADGATAIHKLY